MSDKRKIFFKKSIFLILLAGVLALMVYITYFVLTNVAEIKSAESFKDYVLSFGWAGALVGLAFQILQVFVAIIPGEFIEIGLGYAYGGIVGTVICYAGLIIASSAVFVAVKKVGFRFIELFYSKEKFENLRIVKNTANKPEKLKKLTFVLFLIPGTPKDLLTYFMGLTPLKLSEFLCITMIARIPSVISSTVGGMLIHNGKYVLAVVLFAVTALLSTAGWIWYNRRGKN